MAPVGQASRQRVQVPQRSRGGAYAFDFQHLIDSFSRKGGTGFVGDGGIHFTGGGHHIRLKASHESGEYQVHAKDDQYAKDDCQRGQDRAQFAPGKIAESEGNL